MKPGLTAGMSRTRRFEVDKDRTIGFMGEALRVYATPSMTRSRRSRRVDARHRSGRIRSYA